MRPRGAQRRIDDVRSMHRLHRNTQGHPGTLKNTLGCIKRNFLAASAATGVGAPRYHGMLGGTHRLDARMTVTSAEISIPSVRGGKSNGRMYF